MGLLIAVAATNRYEDPSDPAFVGPDDARSYLTLAQSAPGLPQEPVPFQHSQRIALPYLVGLVHRVMPVSVHRLFQVTVVLAALGILLTCAAILDDLAVGSRQTSLVLTMLTLNPWAFRPYFTFPETVTDLGFVLGLAIALRGLLKAKAATVAVGQLVASLSRQTGLLLVPAAVLWILCDRKAWRRYAVAKRLALCAAVSTLAGAVYLGTAQIAAGFSETNDNWLHVVGMAGWLATQFDVRVLAGFLLRAVAPLLIPVGFLLGIGRRSNRMSDPGTVALLLFASLCIWVQPLLAGPDVTGGNAPRLVTIGLLPLCLALALKLRDAGVFTDMSGSRRLPWAIALLALASLHHWYVYARIPSVEQQIVFAVTYASACLGVLAIAHVERKLNEAVATFR